MRLQEKYPQDVILKTVEYERGMSYGLWDVFRYSVKEKRKHGKQKLYLYFLCPFDKEEEGHHNGSAQYAEYELWKAQLTFPELYIQGIYVSPEETHRIKNMPQQSFIDSGEYEHDMWKYFRRWEPMGAPKPNDEEEI